jgi:CRISPR/Cas system-associated exonuclease Cas4 (RecB family)
MASRRTGKPYIWATWLAKLLDGGQQCVWSAWFKAHYKYDKFEEQAADLVKWNRDHTKLMAAKRRELEADGWTITTEDQNAFKLEGSAAIVAGKPDLIATRAGRVLVVDGKTGRQRESDIWQVLLYLYAVPKSRPDLPTDQLEGEVHYRDGDVALTLLELTPERLAQIVALVKTISSDTPPPKVPSRGECRRCNVGIKDCPQRVTTDRMTAVGDF